MTSPNCIFTYLEGRHSTFAEPLDDAQRALVDSELDRLLGDRIFILRDGEIEDYLPPGVGEVKAIVELTTDRNWINRVPQRERRLVLGQLLCEMLTLEGAAQEALLREIEDGVVVFPEPVV